MDEVVNGIRELSWEIRILRDRVLTVAENLPDEERERALQLTERMTAADECLRSALDENRTESADDIVARLRSITAEIMEELGLISEELCDVTDGLPGGGSDWPPDTEIFN